MPGADGRGQSMLQRYDTYPYQRKVAQLIRRHEVIPALIQVVVRAMKRVKFKVSTVYISLDLYCSG